MSTLLTTLGIAGLRALRVVVLAYVVFAVAVLLFSERLIFRPFPSSYREGPDIVKLRTADGGTIAARWLPNPQARYAILYSHGNAEDLGDLAPFLHELKAEGFSVLAYDYRGYGLSDGRPSERAAYRDAEAAYDYLTRDLGVPAERVILHGRSLGGGPSAHLASTRPAAGLVLESAFTTVFRAYADVPLVPFDRFRVADRLAGLRIPVLVIHGTQDEAVLPTHGRQLFVAAREPKRVLWVEGAGHNDLVSVAGERYWQALRDFAASRDSLSIRR